MPKVTKYDAQGKQQGDFQLDDAVFATPVKEQAVHEALLMQLANRRCAQPRVKGYGEVKGGGCKPYKQKGTGRARMGTLRSMLRRGGAVGLGPDGRANYTIKLPRKVRRTALRSLLSDAVKHGRLAVVENVQYKEPKTKQAMALVDGLCVDANKVLFVIPERDENFEKSVRNIPNVKTILFSNLNPHDLLNFEHVVLFEGAVAKILEVLK